MRLLPTRSVICREFKPVCFVRTPQPLVKDEYPVRELDFLTCIVFRMAGSTLRTNIRLHIY